MFVISLRFVALRTFVSINISQGAFNCLNRRPCAVSQTSGTIRGLVIHSDGSVEALRIVLLQVAESQTPRRFALANQGGGDKTDTWQPIKHVRCRAIDDLGSGSRK